MELTINTLNYNKTDLFTTKRFRNIFIWMSTISTDGGSLTCATPWELFAQIEHFLLSKYNIAYKIVVHKIL